MAFTRKEEKLLHDPYFTVIRETDQFIEVRSNNTGHCWNVFKNTIESGRKIVLYHKHRMKDPYYHQHRTCRTVTEAVQQIKSHDDYVLEKKAAKATAGNGTERHIKVYSVNGLDYQVIPQIRLQGKWLEECGFEPGTEMNIICEEGKLVITRAM